MSSLDQKLKPGITVYLCTLNDQNKIESCLGSLGKKLFSAAYSCRWSIQG